MEALETQPLKSLHAMNGEPKGTELGKSNGASEAPKITISLYSFANYDLWVGVTKYYYLVLKGILSEHG